MIVAGHGRASGRLVLPRRAQHAREAWEKPEATIEKILGGNKQDDIHPAGAALRGRGWYMRRGMQGLALQIQEVLKRAS